MLDKVDIQIPAGAPAGPALAQAFAQLRHHPIPPFSSSKFYRLKADLREQFKIDAVVHLFYRYGKETHKIEIVDAGKKTVWEMAEIVSLLFEIDPWSARLMRIDLAADIEGVPVHWFRDHAFVNRKQFSSRFEKSIDSEVQFVGMGTAQAQTIYAGKRPNLIRIYNKLAEWLRQYMKVEREFRRFNAALAGFEMTPEQRYFGERHCKTFAEFCELEGYYFQEGNTLTRVEQQIGGDRFPPELRTFGDLRHAHEFTPFKGLRLAGTEPILSPVPTQGVSMRNHLASLGYWALQKQLGSEQSTRAFVNTHSNGNGKRILKTIEESLPGTRPALSIEEVYESYRKSTTLQLVEYTRKGIY